MGVERLDESAWNHWSNDREMGGRMGVEYAGVIRITGAGYWRKGEAAYERENQIRR